MPLSANTLIHFTKDKESLKGILEDNFQIFYCKETITLGAKTSSRAIPMVSFCDIPLSQIKDHISKYGSYGLGMTKEWGKKRGLNPVLYLSPESDLSLSFQKALNHFIKIQDGTFNVQNQTDEQRSLINLARYIKNYEANLSRNNVTDENYRFSDEREWRHVPSYADNQAMIFDYASFEKTKEHIQTFLSNLRLSFEPNDIKYIIINDDTEIGEFINHLRYTKGNKYSHSDVERLTTRIITTEQIKSDI
jgi:Putative abortive phage resistance protein AbiGi, antitoxin